MLLAAHNLVRFDHVPQLRNFRVLVANKCCCCCAQVDDAEFDLLVVQYDETTVKAGSPSATSSNRIKQSSFYRERKNRNDYSRIQPVAARLCVIDNALSHTTGSKLRIDQ